VEFPGVRVKERSNQFETVSSNGSDPDKHCERIFGASESYLGSYDGG